MSPHQQNSGFPLLQASLSLSLRLTFLLIFSSTTHSVMDLTFRVFLLFVGGVWAANVTELGLNAFVTSGERAMPSEFSLEEPTPFYWTNLTGHVLNVQAVSAKGQDMYLYCEFLFLFPLFSSSPSSHLLFFPLTSF